MSFTKHKNKDVYKKILVAKTHSQFKRFTEKSVQITDKIFWVRLFNRVFGFIFVIWN